jgi:iron(III) transport system substrate-binding protein
MLLTVDAGNLWQAAEEGLLLKSVSPTVAAAVPAHLRDPDGEWTGLSIRARTVVYNPTRVKAAELSTYEDLASPKWKGRLCLRTSKKVYNQSLVAMMIAEHGEGKTQDIVQGWIDNLAAPPYADDTAAMQAVAAGQCDVTLVNTYYFGRLKEKTPALPLAIFWPNQNLKGETAGVHVNVSGAGITRHAKNPAGAQKLIDWLASPAAQNLYADVNLEYPVNKSVPVDKLVASWGTFKQNLVNVKQAGSLQTRAVRLMDRAGYK